MSGKYKVRFHLAKGEYYRHFQVISPDGRREYYDPEDNFIYMENARLYNNCKVAEKIHGGRNKTVCSWIECDEVDIRGILGSLFSNEPIPEADGKIELKYNPRVNPHWLENGKNVDFKGYPRLFTVGKSVFVGEVV
jgi:hypothetical protein